MSTSRIPAMVFHTKYNEYGEELPIGAARRRVVSEFFVAGVASIVAEYSVLTAEDKINILCPGMSGSFRMPRSIYGDNGLYYVYLEWKPKSPNSKTKVFQLRDTRNKLSKRFYVHEVVCDHSGRAPTSIWNQSDNLKKLGGFFISYGGFCDFYDEFNAHLAKIL
jgi:hypothetical protein